MNYCLAWRKSQLILKKLSDTFAKARVVVYMLGAFSLIGFATAAIFGKLSWVWLVMIAVSLFILASTEAIVAYTVSGSTSSLTASKAQAIFNKDGDNQLELRNDSNDFNYQKMLNESQKGK